MAQTKVKLISDGVIVQSNLHASHGITTAHIGEGSNLYYTDARVGSYLSSNGYATQTDIVAAITDSAPVTLDTLNELAAALGDDPNFATTTATSLGLKAPLASPSFTGNATFGGKITSGNDIVNATAGVYTWVDDTDTYIQRSAGNEITFKTGASTALVLNSSQNAIFAGSVIANTGSKITSSSTDTTFSIETTSGSTIFPILDFVSSHSSAGARIRVSGTDVISLDKSQNVTFAGEIRTANRLAIKETYFGYSSGYKVIQVGESAATKAISLGYNPSGNTSGSFSGNEILIPNNIRILAPAANNSGYYGLMMLNSSNKVLLGASNYLMESNYIMALDTATKNVGIGTDSPSEILQTNKNSAGNIVGGYFTNSQANTGAESVSLAFGLNRSGGDFVRQVKAITFGAEQQWTGTPSTVDGYLAFSTVSNETVSEKMRISSSGNVGINAAASFRFNGAADNTHAVGYDSTIDGSFLRGQLGMRFLTGTGGGSERMRITSGGNVGINHTGPFNQISGTETTLAISNSNIPSLYLNNTSTNGHNHILLSGTDGAFAIYDKTVGANRFVIDSSGNVGIGNSGTAYGRLQIKTASAISFSNTVFTNGANLRLQTGGTAAAGVTTGVSMGVGGAAEAYIGAVQNTSNYADIVFQTYHGSYGERMRITSGGHLARNSKRVWNFTATKSFTEGSSSVNFFRLNFTGNNAVLANITLMSNNPATGSRTMQSVQAMLSVSYQGYLPTMTEISKTPVSNNGSSYISAVQGANGSLTFLCDTTNNTTGTSNTTFVSVELISNGAIDATITVL